MHPSQFEIYVDQLINPESPCYNIGLYIKLNGPLNKEIFHQAVNSSPTVFDAFKMRFDFNDTDPVCYFDKNYKHLDLTEIDFSNKNNPKKEAKCWMQNQFNIPFKIQKQNL